MKKRWKLKTEAEDFYPYEAGEDASYREITLGMEFLLRKYQLFPSERHIKHHDKMEVESRNSAGSSRS